MQTTTAVLGAGSWGSALALVLARNGHTVNLWEFDDRTYQAIVKDHANERYLPGIAFPDNIKPFNDLKAAIANVDDILIVVPSHAFGSVLTALKPLLTSSQRLAWATKGLVTPGVMLHKVAQQVLGKANGYTVISGPTFAKEVASGLPTAIVVASEDSAMAQHWAQILNNANFCTHLSDDIAGVELGGAVKNVIAITVGLSDGLGYGANARSALITIGLQEMLKLADKIGAKRETLYGLSGMGDLILTCTDNQSRNRRFGLYLGEGMSVQQAQEKINQVVEGYANSKEVKQFADSQGLTMPMVNAIHDILYHQADAKEVIARLISY